MKTKLIALALVLFVPMALASGGTQTLRGTIIAYDPVFHSLKRPSFVKNLEATVAKIRKGNAHRAFVKIIFEGFGDEQVAKDVLNGQTPFTVRAVRDLSCDEPSPQWISDPDTFNGSGPFLLNHSHQNQITQEISHLECYRVEVPK